MAVARNAARQKGRKSGTKNGTLFFIVGSLLFVAALPLCLVFAAGMAPTIVAAMTDINPKRYLLRTIAVLNLSGMIVPVAALLHHGLTVVGAAEVLLDPYKWLWMYGAAALGWVCYLGMPPFARLYVDARAVRLEQDLQTRAEALVDEWGEEVTGRKGQD